MAELIVVRHGETDWNRARRLQGHTDVALNANGVEQAARLAVALAGEEIGSIHSSDLARALATAEPVAVALGKPVARHASLRERHYGTLEGSTYAEILERHPRDATSMQRQDVEHALHDGESRETFFRRAVDAVTRIARRADRTGATSPLLIVTHGGVLDMLYRAVHGIPVDVERSWPIANAVVNRLRWRDGTYEIVAWAEST